MAATAAGGSARHATTSSASARPRALPRSISSTLSGRVASIIRLLASSTDSKVEPLGANQPAFLKYPQNIDDFLLFRLYKLSRLALHGVGLMLRREAAISRRDSRTLAYVSKRPGVSLTQLVQIAEVDPVVTGRCVANLVARGLIAKTRLRSKRLVVLTLTNIGRTTYERARSIGQKYNIDFAACLSNDEAKQLDILLTKLEGRARGLTEREVSKTRGDEH